MISLILRDPEAATKLFEAVLDSPNGKRILARLARTCRAIYEPAMNVLWRELDSLVPILGLFPGCLKKAKKPGLGFAKTPSEDDWKAVFKYSERVRQLTYNEAANNVAATVFPILQQSRPRTYLLPKLIELTWKAESQTGLGHCAMFLNPELKVLNLEVGAKLPQISSFLADMSSRTKLTAFSFNSPTSLPEAFTELLLRQDRLERVVLVAPGALSPGVGSWLASLPKLKKLQLDLTGRSEYAVQGFFDELTESGASTPSSIGSTDSGVFSGDELDFSEIRKSALRLTRHLHSADSFAQLRRLQLTGEVSNIVVFLRQLGCSLTQLELVIEDPPDKADWHELSKLLCEKFGDSLQVLRITGTSASRFAADPVRSPAKLEPTTTRLSLVHLRNLYQLRRFEIDLPESTTFTSPDIQCIAKACPNLESLRLSPQARFPLSKPPQITLDAIAQLTGSCRRLHTIALVLNAKVMNTDLLMTQHTSSNSLVRLSVGYSWIDDPLQIAIILSHIAPRLDILRWLGEKNRSGYAEAHAQNWQKAAEILPHLQNVRLLERKMAQVFRGSRPEFVDKSVEAIVSTSERGVHASPETTFKAVQCAPLYVNSAVDAEPQYYSMAVDATPIMKQASVEATISLAHRAVDAVPVLIAAGIDATAQTASKTVQAMASTESFHRPPSARPRSVLFILPSLLDLLSLAYRMFILYPLSVPSRILRLTAHRMHKKSPNTDITEMTEKGSDDGTDGSISPRKSPQVRP